MSYTETPRQGSDQTYHQFIISHILPKMNPNSNVSLPDRVMASNMAIC